MIIGRLRLSLYVGKMTLYLSAGMSMTCVGSGCSGLGAGGEGSSRVEGVLVFTSVKISAFPASLLTVTIKL
jgi:hypothetical protein